VTKERQRKRGKRAMQGERLGSRVTGKRYGEQSDWEETGGAERRR
jgi:hypothetical protein